MIQPSQQARPAHTEHAFVAASGGHLERAARFVARWTRDDLDRWDTELATWFLRDGKTEGGRPALQDQSVSPVNVRDFHDTSINGTCLQTRLCRAAHTGFCTNDAIEHGS